jgi:hypothetical protein
VPVIIALPMGPDAFGGDMFFYHGGIIDIMELCNFDQFTGLYFTSIDGL